VGNFGLPRSVTNDQLISGGSSSGSAVAVVLGIVDFSLGTDTAGSGRVPGAFNGIIGVMPTLGLHSADGGFYALPSYDTVSLFARDGSVVDKAMSVMIEGADNHPWPADARFAPCSVSGDAAATAGSARPPARARVAAAVPENLKAMDPRWRAACETTVGALAELGVEVAWRDVSRLLDGDLCSLIGIVVERVTSSWRDSSWALWSNHV